MSMTRFRQFPNQIPTISLSTALYGGYNTSTTNSREVNMARKRESRVTEEKLQKLIDNWGKRETSEIAAMLDADEASVAYWAAKLRKSMKKQGMSDEMIKKLLPARRKVQQNVYEAVVSRLMSAEPALKRRGRRAKAEG
jgi:mannitol-specific phosphotransferase system IIBC component